MAAKNKASQQPSHAAAVPTDESCPEFQLASFPFTSDQVQQLLDLLKGLSTPDPEASPTGKVKAKEAYENQTKLRASKSEITSVYEFWNKSTFKFDVKKSFDTDSEDDEFMEFIAVFRQKFDANYTLLNTFIDIKSPHLRDALRVILDEVSCVSLREDKPSIDPDVLLTYRSQLEAFRISTSPESPERSQLGKLIEFLETQYASTIDKLDALVQHDEITFDLLPVFFRPNSVVFMISSASERPRCLRFDSGQIQDDNGQKCFVMSCRSLTHNGEFIGEATVKTQISEFQGAMKITELGVYPMEYHPEKSEVIEQLVKRGEKFLSLAGAHFRQYEGHGFYTDKKGTRKFPVSGRVMVDAVLFREKNPNYVFPRLINKSSMDEWFPSIDNGEGNPEGGLLEFSPVVTKQKTPCSREELLICSDTVYAFCFQRKVWGELCVDDIEMIDWSSHAFDQLVIPDSQKEIVESLVEHHMDGSEGEDFDDIIRGKGKNVVVLLHGPPGVGKTLTAEGLAEKKRLPLYSVCAGDLGTHAELLEENLLEITSLAHKWRAIVLIDEADVYLAERSPQDIQRNALVSVFLRHLEHFPGVMFLTTNQVQTFDMAFQSRIHFSIRFPELSRIAKRKIWKTFLDRVKIEASISSKDIENLSGKGVNGRQIKNFVRVAVELATSKKEPLSIKYLEIALDAGDAFDVDYKGRGRIEGLQSYA